MWSGGRFSQSEWCPHDGDRWWSRANGARGEWGHHACSACDDPNMKRIGPAVGHMETNGKLDWYWPNGALASA